MFQQNLSCLFPLGTPRYFFWGRKWRWILFRRLAWRIWWAWIPNIFETATGYIGRDVFPSCSHGFPPRQLAFTFTFPWCDCRRRLETGDELRIPPILVSKEEVYTWLLFLSNEFCCWSCFNNIKAMALFNTIDVMPDPVIQSCRWPFLLTWVSCSFLNWLSVGLVGRHSGQCFEWHDFLWFGTMRRSIFNLLLWGWLKAEHFRFWHTFRGDWWLMDREGNEGDSAEESIGNTFMPGSNNGSIQ